MLPPVWDTFSVPHNDIFSKSREWTGDMGAPGDRDIWCADPPIPGDNGGAPEGGGAIADVVGDRFGPLLELRRGVGRMTPHETEAASPSPPQGRLALTSLLRTGMGEPVSPEPIPHTIPVAPLVRPASAVAAAGAAAALQSTCTFPELEGMWFPLRLFLRRLCLLLPPLLWLPPPTLV